MRAQRDLNPRPTAPQAAILSKLNYGPIRGLSNIEPYIKYPGYELLYLITIRWFHALYINEQLNMQ
jgi:hypothetical protein